MGEVRLRRATSAVRRPLGIEYTGGYGRLDRLIHGIQVKVQLMSLVQLLVVSAGRGVPGDLQQELNRAAQYAKDHLCTVTGLEPLAVYQPNRDFLYLAALPQIYGAVAAAWPELAEFCPALPWDYVRGIFTDRYPMPAHLGPDPGNRS